MRALWYLSLVVLILGNIIDGCATFWLMQHLDGWAEGSLLAVWTWERLGIIPSLVFVKGFLLSIVVFLFWRLLAVAELTSPWVGIRLSTFYGFFQGVMLVLGGTGLFAGVLMRLIFVFFPTDMILAYWDVLPQITWAVFAAFCGISLSIAFVALTVLDAIRLGKIGSGGG